MDVRDAVAQVRVARAISTTVVLVVVTVFTSMTTCVMHDQEGKRLIKEKLISEHYSAVDIECLTSGLHCPRKEEQGVK